MENERKLWQQVRRFVEKEQIQKISPMFSKGKLDPTEAWFLLSLTKKSGIQLTELLLRLDADPKSPDAIMSTMGHNTLTHVEALQLILSKGADPNVRNIYGTSPLMRAADTGSTNAVKILLEAGADPNYRNQTKGSALLFACDHGYKEIVGLLLEAGAKTDIADEDRRTPLGLAKKHPELKKEKELLERLAGGKKVSAIEKFNITIKKLSAKDLPKEIASHKKFSAWLVKTGMIHISKGRKSVESIHPRKYRSESKIFQAWFDSTSIQRMTKKGHKINDFIPVAGEGGDDWCILYNLSDNNLYGWWHEEFEKLIPLGTQSLDKLMENYLKKDLDPFDLNKLRK